MTLVMNFDLSFTMPEGSSESAYVEVLEALASTMRARMAVDGDPVLLPGSWGRYGSIQGRPHYNVSAENVVDFTGEGIKFDLRTKGGPTA